jgi:hypothetical protein
VGFSLAWLMFLATAEEAADAHTVSTLRERLFLARRRASFPRLLR